MTDVLFLALEHLFACAVALVNSIDEKPYYIAIADSKQREAWK